LGKNTFKFAPLHTDDLAVVIGEALKESTPGRFSVSGPEKLNLRQIVT
jgi:hypothetical protein